MDMCIVWIERRIVKSMYRILSNLLMSHLNVSVSFSRTKTKNKTKQKTALFLTKVGHAHLPLAHVKDPAVHVRVRWITKTRKHPACIVRSATPLQLAFLADFPYCQEPRSGELRTQKLKSHLVRTQSLNVLPVKPGVSQYKPYMLRLLPGISSLLISTFPAHSPAFFQNLSQFFPVLAVANTVFCVGPLNKLYHPA